MPETMKAVVKAGPQPGVELMEVALPEVAPGEVLVKVKSASICGTDLHIYKWDNWASRRVKPPRILGHEICGEVVEVGREVKSIKVGDFVTIECHIPCRACYQCRTGRYNVCRNLKIIGVDRDGGFAEYISVPEIDAWANDPQLPLEWATIQDPLGNAIDSVLCEEVAGKTVAVVGCGPIGLLAIGVARASGAAQIYAWDINDYRLAIAAKMGATATFNPLCSDVVAEIMEATGGNGVDVVLEMSGNARALRQGLSVLTPGGRISLLGLSDGPVEIDLNNDIVFKAARVYGITGRNMFSTWYKAARLLSTGRLDPTPVITHRLPLAEFKAAMQLVESGNCGKVLLYP